MENATIEISKREVDTKVVETVNTGWKYIDLLHNEQHGWMKLINIFLIALIEFSIPVLFLILLTGLSVGMINNSARTIRDVNELPNEYVDSLYYFSNQKENYSLIFPYGNSYPNKVQMGNHVFIDTKYATKQRQCYGATVGMILNYDYTQSTDEDGNVCYKISVLVKFRGKSFIESYPIIQENYVFDKCYYSISEIESNDTVNQFFNSSNQNVYKSYYSLNPWEEDLPMKYRSVAYFKVIYEVGFTSNFRVVTSEEEDILPMQDYWRDSNKSSCYVKIADCTEYFIDYNQKNMLNNKTCLTFETAKTIYQDTIGDEEYINLIENYNRDELISEITEMVITNTVVMLVIILVIGLVITIPFALTIPIYVIICCWCPRRYNKMEQTTELLDVVVTQEDKKIFYPTDKMCTICLVNFISEKCFNDCGHAVCCESCINLVENKCPYCRKEPFLFSYS